MSEAPFVSQKVPKRTQDAPMTRPRGTPEAPEAVQEWPGGDQERRGRDPNPSEIEPAEIPKRKYGILIAVFVAKACAERLKRNF